MSVAIPIPLLQNLPDVNVVDASLGNGTTDATTAIQEKLNAAGIVKGGVYAPPGTYKLTASLVVPSGVTFFGSGNGTILKHVNSSQFDAIYLTAVDDVVIRDMVLDGNNAQGRKGIAITTGCSSVHVERVTAKNWSSYHFWIFNSDHCSVVNCTADGVADVGFEMLGATYSTFRGCVVKNLSANNAFNIWAGTKFSSVVDCIADCTGGDTTSTGIAITTTPTEAMTEDITISNNVIVSPAYGIRVSGTAAIASDLDVDTKIVRQVTITGNTVWGYTNAGIRLATGVRNVVISANSLSAGSDPVGNAVGLITPATVKELVVIGNTSIGGKSFISGSDIPALVIASNLIISPVPVGISNVIFKSAIHLSGAGCAGAIVAQNRIVDPGTPTDTSNGIALSSTVTGVVVQNNVITESRVGVLRGMAYGVVDYGALNYKVGNLVDAGLSGDYYTDAASLPPVLLPAGIQATFPGTPQTGNINVTGIIGATTGIQVGAAGGLLTFNASPARLQIHFQTVLGFGNDTGLYRVASKSIAVGNGQPSNIDGELVMDKIRVAGLSSYANNAAALASGKIAGQFYMVTGTDPQQVAVVV